MARWKCKCGETLNDSYDNTRFLSYYDNESDLEDVSHLFDENKLYKYYEHFDKIPDRFMSQCISCGRLWFDIDEIIIKENRYIEKMSITSNIISFKPEPVFIEEGIDIMEELRRTADKNNCEYELKYSNGKYTLEIDGKEISDESLSGVLQILRYGKKYN